MWEASLKLRPRFGEPGKCKSNERNPKENAEAINQPVLYLYLGYVCSTVLVHCG
jgi:hypothetical protein